ncbi:MAG: transporter substrate-binding protein [Bradyrhizobium sp.]|nr:transporter substrate-binding protein [Bradyrhizobium sp.]
MDSVAVSGDIGNGSRPIGRTKLTFQPRARETGQLLVAINLGNAALVQISQDGTIRGRAADLARRIAEGAGRFPELIGYPDARSILDGQSRCEWDIALIARDPDRMDAMAFSMAYSAVEVCYATRESDRFLHSNDVDVPGARIASAQGTGYDSMLRRQLKHAEIISFESAEQSFDRFLSGEADCVACVREGLIRAFGGLESVRIVEGHAGTIEQAVAVARDAADLLPIINAIIAGELSPGEA